MTRSAGKTFSRAKLQAGRSWADVTNRYDTNADNRNALGLITDAIGGRDEIAFRTLYALASEGDISDPVEDRDEWIVVQVDTIEPARQKDIKEATIEIGEYVRRDRRRQVLNGLVAKWRGEQNVVVHPERLADLPSWEEVNANLPKTAAPSSVAASQGM